MTLTLTNPDGANIPIQVFFGADEARMDPTSSFVLSLSHLKFPLAKDFQSKNQSFANNSKQAREFQLVVKCDQN